MVVFCHPFASSTTIHRSQVARHYIHHYKVKGQRNTHAGHVECVTRPLRPRWRLPLSFSDTSFDFLRKLLSSAIVWALYLPHQPQQQKRLKFSYISIAYNHRLIHKALYIVSASTFSFTTIPRTLHRAEAGTSSDRRTDRQTGKQQMQSNQTSTQADTKHFGLAIN